MKLPRLFIFFLLAVVIAFVYYSFSSGPSQEDYSKEILQERKEKNDFLKSGDGSPFASLTGEFRGLKYFEPDLRYRINARLIPIEDKKVSVLQTSDGLEQKYLEYAYATFDLEEKENKLLILEVMEMGPQRGKLFLAFADKTSGKETYGAGRYLDIKKVPAATTTVLDFNQAYNPYCAYNDSYSCPFPPAENVLKVAIRAGEKVYHNE